jgi:hypothetical protein
VIDLGALPPFTPASTDVIKTDRSRDDGEERPPLRGRTDPPAGLGEVNWAELEDAYDTAELTPLYIEALTSDNAGDLYFGGYGLYAATTHQGRLCSAGEAAVPFLVDLLDKDNEYAAMFLSRIVVGETHFIVTPRDIDPADRRFEFVAAYRPRLRAYFARTGDQVMLRLLTIMPESADHELPAILTDFSLREADDQAGVLLAYGFAAARANGTSPGGQAQRLIRIEHTDLARELMLTSSSLVVRLAAAVCLAYTGLADADVKALLRHLAQGEYPSSGPTWTYDWGELASEAWLFTATLDDLLDADGEGPNLFSRLVEASRRHFPPRAGGLTPMLPSDLDVDQRRVLQATLDDAPGVLTWVDVLHEGINLPSHPQAARRTLGIAEGPLMLEVDGLPIWYLLERYALSEGDPPRVLAALEAVDAWAVLSDVFQPSSRRAESLAGPDHQPTADINAQELPEQLTLSRDYWLPERTAFARLIDVFATALAADRYRAELTGFLKSWLDRIGAMDGSDLAARSPAHRIGAALLAAARGGWLDEHLYPLIRPYHRFSESSVVPQPILAAIISHLPPGEAAARSALCGLTEETVIDG